MTPDQMDAAIAELKSQHIDRADLWVNDQPTSAVTCGSTFSYVGWSATGLEAFTEKLAANGIAATYTVSPATPTETYIKSLSGLWALANRTGSDIEYDLEGAWTPRWGPQNCGLGGGRPDLPAMEAALMKETHAAAPGVKVGISTTPAHFKDHATLLKSADWVAPQLYELTPKQMEIYVSALKGDAYRVQAIWPAVRVDTALEKLIPGLNYANRIASSDPKVKGVAIWGRVELTYADKWLRRTN
jgi:hypothetical protein